MSQKVKTVSLHYKRRRADAIAYVLNDALDNRKSQRESWLDTHGLPPWTRHFEVRRARTRFHYRVCAVS